LHEEKKAEMNKRMRELLVVAMLGVMPIMAVAQRKDQDKRPPKDPVKVIDRKEQRPPPRPSPNQPPPKHDKRGRPD
jgi:hypothetical protein